MLIPQQMPDAMDGGKQNTVEKILDVRDVELEIDEEGEEKVIRIIREPYASKAAAGGGEEGGSEPPLSPSEPLSPRSPRRMSREAMATSQAGTSGAQGQQKRAKMRHTKATAAATAAGVPYDVGIIRRTKRSIIYAMRRAPDNTTDDVEFDDAPPVQLAAVLFAPDTEQVVKYEAGVRAATAAAASGSEPVEVKAEEVGDDEPADGAMEVEVEEEEADGEEKPLPSKPRVRKEVRQYLCKLRCFSYARSEWLSATEIEEDGKLSNKALQRFLKRLSEGEPVDPAYLECMQIQRVIGHRQRELRPH